MCIRDRPYQAGDETVALATGNDTNQPLPVTLLDFAAQYQDGGAALRWRTASELRNRYFAVESSPDGTTFRQVGQVAGAGTSTQPRSYQFLDANLARYAAPQVYYRLRQVDDDGTGTYSPVRAVPVPVSYTHLTLPTKA